MTDGIKAMDSTASGLLIIPKANAPLTADQRKYNQLVQKIDKLRAKLLAWQTQMPIFAASFNQRMTPLLQRLSTTRQQLALSMASLLAGSSLTATERQTLIRAFCELAAMVVMSEFIDEAGISELTALHDQYAEVSLDQQDAAELEGFKGYFEHMTGVDLGEQTFDSQEDLMRHAQEILDAQAQAREAASGEAPLNPTKSPKRQSAAQRKRAEKAQQAEQKEQAANLSVREIYRKLASALHPDRATDEADRAERTAMMQRVNQAYEAKDLLALFALQLEIEQVDPEHLARASAERVRHYNQVLASQLRELQHELEQRETAFAMELGLIEDDNLDPATLGRVLDGEVRQIQDVIKDTQFSLAQMAQPTQLKRWLKQTRREQAFDDEDPFGLPF